MKTSQSYLRRQQKNTSRRTRHQFEKPQHIAYNWQVNDWDTHEEVEPNSNTICWRFTNPNQIRFEKLYVKVTKTSNENRTHGDTSQWYVLIDGKRADCTFDEQRIGWSTATYRYEMTTEIQGKGSNHCDTLNVSAS